VDLADAGERIAAHIPGAQLLLSAVQDVRVGGRQSNSDYQYTLQGDNISELLSWAPKLEKAMRKLKDLRDVSSDQQNQGLQAIVVMLVVALVAFSLFQYVGDPVQLMLGQFATPNDRIRLTHDLGLDRPFYVQFYHIAINALHGQFGVSLRIGKPVSVLLAQRLPARLELSICAALLARCGRLGRPIAVITRLRLDAERGRRRPGKRGRRARQGRHHAAG